MSRIRAALLFPALLLAAVPALSPAAEPAPPPGAGLPQRMPGIDVLGHYDNGIGTSDAASQGAATARLIESRPVLRPAELLEFVPGVIVTQHSGDGKANQYFLRGFNLDHGTDFATRVAGMPVNMPTHAHGQGYTDLNFLIPELVRRIDYRKGPYFADLGDFSSAGAADLALWDRLPANLATITVGPDGYRRALVAASIGAAGGDLTAAVESGRHDGPWDVPQDLSRTSAVLRWHRGTPGDEASVTAMDYRATWTATDQVPRRAVDAGRIGRYGSLDASDGGDTARSSLSAELTRPLLGGKLSANAYAIRSRLNLFSNFTYFLDNPVEGDQFEQAERRRVAGGAARMSWPLRPGGWDTLFSTGAEARRDRLLPVALYPTAARRRLGITREDQVRQQSAGVFAEVQVQWADWLRTIAGARHDRYRFEVRSSLAGNSGRAGDSLTSPKASLVLGPWAESELFINAGRGFHSNDARGTTIRVDPASGDLAERVTPLARSRGAEIGFRTRWLPGLTSSLALWRLALDSELLFVGDAGTTEPSRPSTRRGLEWNSHYVLGRHVQLDLDIAASRARFTDGDPAGPRIPGALDRVIAAGLSLTDIGPWSGQLQLRHFGPRPLVEDDSRRSRATTLANLRATWQWSRQARLALDVFNLFDRRASDIDYFYASRLRGEDAGGVDDHHFHPVEGRTARMTLTVSF